MVCTAEDLLCACSDTAAHLLLQSFLALSAAIAVEPAAILALLGAHTTRPAAAAHTQAQALGNVLPCPPLRSSPCMQANMFNVTAHGQCCWLADIAVPLEGWRCISLSFIASGTLERSASTPATTAPALNSWPHTAASVSLQPAKPNSCRQCSAAASALRCLCLPSLAELR